LDSGFTLPLRENKRGDRMRILESSPFEGGDENEKKDINSPLEGE
jgi:hypothetical protein